MPPKSISLLYTTARHAVIDDVIGRWFDEGHEAIEMILVTDEPVTYQRNHPNVRHVINAGRRDCVTGWNLAALHSVGDILIQVSDDLFPPPGWAKSIRGMIEQLSQVRPDVVLNLLDERKILFSVFHPVMTRSAYEKLNVIYPPDFESMYCDNWFCAYHRKYSCYGEGHEVFWHHRHRTTHAVEIDDVTRLHESSERYVRGRETFAKYVREHGLSV